VEIKNNCNAIYEFGLYAAAVGAYPTSIGAKAAGICGIGSWGGRCLSMGDDLMERGATRGATAAGGR
jgi:hypothetical protein